MTNKIEFKSDKIPRSRLPSEKTTESSKLPVSNVGVRYRGLAVGSVFNCNKEAVGLGRNWEATSTPRITTNKQTATVTEGASVDDFTATGFPRIDQDKGEPIETA